MVDALILWISLLKTVTVALGLYIVWLGAKAYGKRPRASTLWLTLGVAVVTLGAIAEGVAFQLLGDLPRARLVEAVVTLFGFGALVYSLHSR